MIKADIENYTDDTIIIGTTSDDYIRNSYFNEYGDRVTINAGNGNDTIENHGASVSVDAGDGNDFFFSNLGGDSGWNTSNYNVTVCGGKGNDTIGSYEFSTMFINSLIDGGSDDDYIYILNPPDTGNNTIIAGKGNDEIHISGEKFLIKYANGDGSDTIFGFDSNDTLHITEGNINNAEMIGKDFIIEVDSEKITFSNIANKAINIKVGNEQILIYNRGTELTLDGGGKSITNNASNENINGTEYNDIIDNKGDYVSINSGSGNDSVKNESTKTTIITGIGNDSVKNLTAATINSGAGDDYIYNKGRYGNSINAGDGNDLIINDFANGNDGTVLGGIGNDTIDNGIFVQYETFQYSDGDGNDVIFGYNATDTIKIVNGNFTTQKIGEDFIITVGNGSINLVNAADVEINIVDSNGKLRKYNENGYFAATNPNNNKVINSTVISAPNYYDEIYNYGSKVKIVGTDNDDFIYSTDSRDVTINGGAGNDSIDSTSNGINKRTVINGDSGNDYIYTWDEYSTINGGVGNDSIVLSKNRNFNVVKYSNGDGDDTISGINTTDTLQITGAKYTTSESGNDLIIGVGTGSMIIIGGANIDFTIDGTLEGGSNTIPADTTPAEDLPIGITVKNGVLTASNKFKGNEINVEQYEDVTKVNAAALSQAITIVGNDSDNSIKAGKGNDTISGGLGKNTLAGGAGKDVFVYAGGNDIITDYKSGEDKINLNLADVTKTSVKGSDVILTTDEGTLTIKGAKDKVITFTDDSGADTNLIFFAETSYTPLDDGLTYDAKRTLLTASAKFSDTEINLSDYLSTISKVNASAVKQDLNILGNGNNNSIKGGNGADTINGGEGNDTLTGGKGSDVFVYDGGNDVITDYKVGEDKINLNLANVTKSSVKGSDVILTTDEGTLTIKGTKDKAITFTDGSGADTNLIFFADTSYSPLDDGLTYDAKRTVLTASAKFSGTEIDLGDYLSTISKVNASAVKQDLNILGNGNNNSIKGGNGADTINGGEGNDTLTGGKGSDVFVYDGGNDVITDYKVGEDKINLNLADVTKSSVKGSDVILTTDKGTLTIKGTKDKAITFTDDSGADTNLIFFADTSYSPLDDGLTYDAKRTVLTASAKFSGNEIDLSDYLSTVTKVNVSAVKQGVNIIGNGNNNSIKGGNGADTIGGGEGNDTLTGGKGEDIFVYESGNDVITDYKSGEDKIEINGTISNTSHKGKDVIFKVGNGSLTVKNSKGKEISVTDSNGNSQTYSKTFDLLYDNNFMTDDLALDSITEKKFEVQNIESQNNSDLSQPVITYGDDKQ